MLNIGIIGPGRVAERHANALKEVSEAKLWSVCGSTIDKAQEFATKHQGFLLAQTFDDISKMLADPNLDAVIIATPDRLHVEHMIAAMKARKAILIEKPVCVSTKEIKEIVSVYHQYNNIIAVGYYLRWHQGLRALVEKMHHNALGNIHHLRLHWAVDFIDHAKWRISSEYSAWCCLSVLGTHLIDFVRWAMIPICGEIREIKSIVKNLETSQSDGAVLILMHFESGATVEIFCSVLFDSPLTLEVYAEKKNALGYDLAGRHESRKITIDAEPVYFENLNPYVSQLKDFVRAVSEKGKPEVSLEEGLENVKNLIMISERHC